MFPVAVDTPQATIAPGAHVVTAEPGDFVLVCTRVEGGGTERGVHARPFSVTGAPVGSEFIVRSGLSSVDAAIAAAPENAFTTAWIDFAAIDTNGPELPRVATANTDASDTTTSPFEISAPRAMSVRCRPIRDDLDGRCVGASRARHGHRRGSRRDRTPGCR